ncbi:uncharacterized protein LOC114313483 isoform X1 [Camellia sinensis]|uniref:uncharacterized protein LOC114313483 isoform X1 n=2 Tax=Camellia sinensis TaxID=4442 RepID=UPI0010368131|nr:uncharacterized protein LOC114313483 isoform X1 [Camellia sinensis]XP_028115666.1 uncharacterized protein LOC114313483 isoform X1 [Camellia sinensis]
MTEPSKVIHVRNVGHEISENDLHQLFQQFGVVTKVVMLRAKNQALLQMQDIPSAVNALQFYTNVQPSIRGMNVYVQFSSHQELTTMDQNSQGRGDEERTLSSLKLPRAVVTNGLSSSVSVDECPSIDNSERTDGGAFDGSASHIQNNGRRRQKVQDPARDLSIQVLEKFSRVTRFSGKVIVIFLALMRGGPIT